MTRIKRFFNSGDLTDFSTAMRAFCKVVYRRIFFDFTKFSRNLISYFHLQNGFKCHTSSEAHQRQLLLFAETPESFLDAYSGEFEKSFISLLSRCHGTKRTFANAVYQEYIKEKDHTHMNATKWTTLVSSQFAKNLWLYSLQNKEAGFVTLPFSVRTMHIQRC